VTGIHPSEAVDGAEIIYCDYFDKHTKMYCKKLFASCTKHQFGKKRRADLPEAEVRTNRRMAFKLFSDIYRLIYFLLRMSMSIYLFLLLSYHKVCACPLSDGTFCPLPSRACQKHIDWEAIKQAALMLEERSLEELSKGVDFEEQVCDAIECLFSDFTMLLRSFYSIFIPFLLYYL
jgi:hypothetical protein